MLQSEIVATKYSTGLPNIGSLLIGVNFQYSELRVIRIQWGILKNNSDYVEKNALVLVNSITQKIFFGRHNSDNAGFNVKNGGHLQKLGVLPRMTPIVKS